MIFSPQDSPNRHLDNNEISHISAKFCVNTSEKLLVDNSYCVIASNQRPDEVDPTNQGRIGGGEALAPCNFFRN